MPTIINRRYLDQYGPVTGYGSPAWDKGLDVDLKVGDPVTASRGGKVVFAGPKGGFGNQVVIREANGTESMYSHLDQIGVKQGDFVQPGQTLGPGGRSGKVISMGKGDGSHLDLTQKKAGGGYFNAKEVEKNVSNRMSIEQIADLDKKIDMARTKGKSDTEILDFFAQNDQNFSKKLQTARAKKDDRAILNYLSTSISGRMPTVPSVAKGQEMAQEEPRKYSLGELPGQALKNLPKSFLGLATGLLNVVAHPVDTAKGISNVIQGTAQTGFRKYYELLTGDSLADVPKTKEEEAFKGMVDMFKERYGGYDELKRTIAEDPVGFALDASMILTGGGSAMVKGAGALEKAGVTGRAVSGLGKVGEATYKVGRAIEPIEATARGVGKLVSPAKKVGQYAFTQTTGLKPETVSEIVKAPEKFTGEAMAQLGDRQALAQSVVGPINKRLKELSRQGKEYEVIRASDEVVKMDNWADDILSKKGIKIKDGLQLEFDRGSVPLSSAEQAKLQKFYEDFSLPGNYTVNDILNARNTLDDFKLFKGDSTAFKRLALDLRAKLNKIARPQIQGLKAIDDFYSTEKSILNEAKAGLFNREGNLTDAGISKIANMTGKGKELMIERVAKVVPDIRDKVNTLKAIENIKSAEGIMIGQYAKGAIIGGGIVTGSMPAIIGGLLTNPSILVPIIRSYGKFKLLKSGVVDGIISKIKSGVELTEKEGKIFLDAVEKNKNKIIEGTKEKVGKMAPSPLAITDQGVSAPIPKMDFIENAPKTKREGAISQFSIKKGGMDLYGHIFKDKPPSLDTFYFKEGVSGGKGVATENFTKALDEFKSRGHNEFTVTDPSDEMLDFLKRKEKQGLIKSDGKYRYGKMDVAQPKFQIIKSPGKLSLKSNTSISGKPRVHMAGLDEEGKAREIASFNKLDTQRDKIISKYKELHGNVINPDDFRELVHDEKRFGPYDGTKAQTVHEASSEISNYVKDKAIDSVKEGDMVLFTSGGPGSGKTTAIEGVAPGAFDATAFAYDSVLGNVPKAVKDINKITSKGGDVLLYSVVRDVEDAWINGVVKRAMTKGRTVPLGVFLDGTEKASKAIKELYSKFKDDPQVMIEFVDNRYPGQKAKAISFDKYEKIDLEGLRDKYYKDLEAKTEEMYKNGKITKKIRDGLLAKG